MEGGGGGGHTDPGSISGGRVRLSPGSGGVAVCGVTSGIIFSFNSVLKGGNKNAWNHTLMRSQNDVLQSFMSNVHSPPPPFSEV